jgi:hypothetical protein
MAIADGLAQPCVARHFAPGDDQPKPGDVLHPDEGDPGRCQRRPEQISRGALGKEAFFGFAHRADLERVVERRSNHRRQREAHAVQAVVGDAEAPDERQRPQHADAAAAIHPQHRHQGLDVVARGGFRRGQLRHSGGVGPTGPNRPSEEERSVMGAVLQRVGIPLRDDLRRHAADYFEFTDVLVHQ